MQEPKHMEELISKTKYIPSIISKLRGH